MNKIVWILLISLTFVAAEKHHAQVNNTATA
jgi:hypothetical protein